MASVEIGKQIDALARAVDGRNAANRGEVAKGKMDQTEAATEAVALDAALATLRWVQDNEKTIKEAALAKHVARREGAK